MLGARMTSIFRAGEKAVVAARRGMRMIVSVTLNLIIAAPLIIPMNVRLHHLMLIRAMFVLAMFVLAMFVGSILRADQRRGQCGHRESR